MSTDRRTCTRCGVEVVVGCCETGFDVVLDALELDTRGELLAAMAGVATFTHHLGADLLAYRSPFQIRHRPAGTRPRTAVRPLHRCTERNTRP